MANEAERRSLKSATVEICAITFVSDSRMPKYLLWLPVAVIICVSLAVSSVYAQDLSDHHKVNIDSSMKKKMSPEALKSVEQFFYDAELAIEKENLGDLMNLYSDHYKNASHTKQSASAIWIRIFEKFDNMASVHNMRIKTYSPDSNVVIIRCSGLLMGKPVGEAELITIDSWTNEDHVLSRAKKGDAWKLIGTAGQKKRKRLWFDKPMHPLF